MQLYTSPEDIRSSILHPPENRSITIGNRNKIEDKLLYEKGVRISGVDDNGLGASYCVISYNIVKRVFEVRMSDRFYQQSQIDQSYRTSLEAQ